MNKLNYIDWIALLVLFIGGLNWGLVGFFNFDLISTIFGVGTILSRLIFAVMGLSALYSLITTAPKITGLEEYSQQPTMNRIHHKSA